MNSLKKLSMAATMIGLGAMSSFAEIKVGENLGISGFLDMSASGMLDSADDAEGTLSANVDQFEIDFMWKFGDKVSARADINVETAKPSGTGVAFEQGFVTATLGSLTLSTGRFLSSSGFEAAEPTGLYQYSVSKSMSGCATGGPDCVYGGYQNGVNAAWTSPMFGIYGAIVTDLWATAETELINTPGFEGQISVTPVEGVTAKLAYLFQMYDEDAAATLGDENQQLLNVWASYALGPITAAVEYNHLFSWNLGAGARDESGSGWMAMGNYKLNDQFAATLRYSGIVFPDFPVDGEGDLDQEVTVSPSVALSPNWLALAEYRFNIEAEQSLYAVETTFSF